MSGDEGVPVPPEPAITGLTGLTGVRHGVTAPLPTAVGPLAVVEGDRSTDGTLFTEGVYEPQETALLRTLFAPGMRVLDAGANVGYFSLLAARHIGPAGVVHAFEPEPVNFRVLRRNVTASGYGNIETWACALSDRSGTQALYLSRSNLGRHSFAFSNVPATGAAVDVPTRTLDAFAADLLDDGPPILLKIDVEGAEGRVLDGAADLLARDAVTVWFELWPEGIANSGGDPDRLLRRLEGYGFHAALYDDVALTPVLLSSVRRNLRRSWHDIRYLLLDRSPERIVAAAEAVSAVDPLHREPKEN
ncbi:FkbM family methyltransferase [Streptomyces sp. NPDC004031]